MQIFEKMSQKALNRVLTPAVDRSRRELSESSGIIEKTCILRRVMVVLLQEKNFGPNVRYCVFGFTFFYFWGSVDKI